MKRLLPAILVAITACATVVRPPQDAPPEAAATPPVTKGATKADTPAAKTAGKGPAPTPPPAAARKPATPAKAEAAAALDLKALEQQLTATKAIGVMTKLSIKNQVDDLIEQFRDYYDGRLKTSLADLRRPYEMLLMKVLAVVQDGDPALASKINASREAIWAILADREKFARAAS